MGSGAFLAARSSDAVLVSSAPGDLAFAFEHSRRTLRVLRGNFVRALAYNAIILPVAAAGMVPPWAAALGMTASSAVVVLNAMRLRGADGTPVQGARNDREDASPPLPAFEPAGGAAG
jgi:Cu2+-exporting ATPase